MRVLTSAGLILAGMMSTMTAFAQAPETHFKLVANPKFAPCLGVPGKPAPVANVTVLRGESNDLLLLRVNNLRPNLQFDVFTVQNSALLASGAPDLCEFRASLVLIRSASGQRRKSGSHDSYDSAGSNFRLRSGGRPAANQYISSGILV